jgi:hypothetical protein
MNHKKSLWCFGGLAVLLVTFSLVIIRPAFADWIQSVDITDVLGNEVADFQAWDPIKITINFTITNDDPKPAIVQSAIKGFGQKFRERQRIRQRGDYSVTQYVWPTEKTTPGTQTIQYVLRVKNLEGDLIGKETGTVDVTISGGVE